MRSTSAALLPHVEHNDDLGFLEHALETPGPVVVEGVVDPFEPPMPPMPPKVTRKQAFKFAESLARGEPNRGKIALTVAEDKVRELV